MNYEINFSDEARQTLEEIKGQIQSRWGKNEVIEFENRADSVILLICTSPYIYKATLLFPNVRKAFVHRNCTMFYKIEEQKISVLFFIDNRQEPIF